MAFPIAVFASKGSGPHVTAGRCFVGGYLVVCVTGLLLEMERTTGPHLFFTVAALIFLLDAGLDLRISIKRRPPKVWWFKHARKMVMAQVFLAAGIPFRCADLEHVGFWTMATSLLVLLTGTIAAWHFRRRLRIEAGTSERRTR